MTKELAEKKKSVPSVKHKPQEVEVKYTLADSDINNCTQQLQNCQSSGFNLGFVQLNISFLFCIGNVLSLGCIYDLKSAGFQKMVLAGLKIFNMHIVAEIMQRYHNNGDEEMY